MKYYNPEDKTLLSNWFDPHDRTHMEAYRELKRTGVWPESFQQLLRKNKISIDTYWDMQLRNRIAEAWIEHFFSTVEEDT